MPAWIHEISVWAIAHKDQLTLWATIFSGIGAVASALAAFVVMMLTVTLAKDNRMLRKAGTEPEVVAYLLPDERHINILNLVVTNIGRGSARNIELEFVGDLEWLRKRSAQMPKSKRVLPWLPQDEKFVQIFGNALDFFEDGQPPEFNIRAHFEDSAGRRKTTVSPIAIADFDGVGRVRGTDEDSTEALKLIAKTIDGWGGLNRLKVETATSAQIESERRAQYEAAMERRKRPLD
jgi:hypothetical protein